MTQTTITLILAIICIILMANFYVDKRKKNEEKKAREVKFRNEKQNKIKLIDRFLTKLDLAKTLNEIYILHLQIWGSGIQNDNIGPDKYGIFRTNDIMLMTKNEIYLGNICGLITHTLEVWEKYEDNKNDNCYDIVLGQYKRILMSNLKEIKRQLKNEIR